MTWLVTSLLMGALRGGMHTPNNLRWNNWKLLAFVERVLSNVFYLSGVGRMPSGVAQCRDTNC